MTTLQELSFPPEYFCDEIRDGFFVSETMKRLWATQLVVLGEIDKICKRHDIKWYAESGTMLGAVRHKGYIPWDDDLDISMFRDDYREFLTYARKELPEGYRILSSEDDEFENPFGRIVNCDAISFFPEHLQKFFGCQFVVGVDIFPLDRVYKDIKKEEERMLRGSIILNVICGIRDETMSDEEISEKIEQIEKENNVKIRKDETLRDLLKLFERIAQENNNGEADEVAIMSAWIGLGRLLYFKSYFDEWTELPFEVTKLRAPAQYHRVLKACYGDYMKAVKGSAGHDYPVYRGQEELYRNTKGNDPGRFYFKKDSFSPKTEKQGLLSQQKEMLKGMQSIHERIQDILVLNGTEQAAVFLQSCQSAAMAIGSILEGKYGMGNMAVKALEDYCETVYEASVNWDEDSKKHLDESLNIAENKIEMLIGSEPKEVVFLLCKASWWDSIKDVYEKYSSNEKYRVRVIPTLYSYLGNTGDILGAKTDIDEFRKIPEIGDKITNLADYDFEKMHPDVIVFQFPYDDCSRAMAIPKEVYSDRLSGYTDDLVFVPYLEPDPPESEDDVVYAVMQELVEQPAVFNADRILVGDEKLRRYYVKKLVEMTDESLREYWNDRVISKSDFQN